MYLELTESLLFLYKITVILKWVVFKILTVVDVQLIIILCTLYHKLSSSWRYFDKKQTQGNMQTLEHAELLLSAFSLW